MNIFRTLRSGIKVELSNGVRITFPEVPLNLGALCLSINNHFDEECFCIEAIHYVSQNHKTSIACEEDYIRFVYLKNNVNSSQISNIYVTISSSDEAMKHQVNMKKFELSIKNELKSAIQENARAALLTLNDQVCKSAYEDFCRTLDKLLVKEELKDAQICNLCNKSLINANYFECCEDSQLMCESCESNSLSPHFYHSVLKRRAIRSHQVN